MQRSNELQRPPGPDRGFNWGQRWPYNVPKLIRWADWVICLFLCTEGLNDVTVAHWLIFCFIAKYIKIRLIKVAINLEPFLFVHSSAFSLIVFKIGLHSEPPVSVNICSAIWQSCTQTIRSLHSFALFIIFDIFVDDEGTKCMKRMILYSRNVRILYPEIDVDLVAWIWVK